MRRRWPICGSIKEDDDTAEGVLLLLPGERWSYLMPPYDPRDGHPKESAMAQQRRMEVETAERTRKKIEGFARLPEGWHYGSGSPATARVIDLALRTEAMLRNAGYPKTDAFPGVSGEIVVTGYKDRRSVSVEVSDEGPY
jgi:hypothetical protein